MFFGIIPRDLAGMACSTADPHSLATVGAMRETMPG
jgi:hypothetical protein